jgi:hypothetical protein
MLITTILLIAMLGAIVLATGSVEEDKITSAVGGVAGAGNISHHADHGLRGCAQNWGRRRASQD